MKINVHKKIIEEIKALGCEVLDFGCFGLQSVDYLDYAEKNSCAIINGKAERGILICETGIGISIAANKIKGVRSAVAHNHLTAQPYHQHNDANIMAFGARVIGIAVACECVKIFLTTNLF